MASKKASPSLLRAYGDLKDDGALQLSFTLPVAPSARAKEAARQFAEKLGLKHVLVYSNKTWGDVIYGQALSQLAAQYPQQLRIVHCLTREPNAALLGPNVHSGRLSEKLLRELIPDPTAAHVYCCGPGITKYDREAAQARGEAPTPRFLESALAALAALGVPGKQVHRESYG